MDLKTVGHLNQCLKFFQGKKNIRYQILIEVSLIIEKLNKNKNFIAEIVYLITKKDKKKRKI